MFLVCNAPAAGDICIICQEEFDPSGAAAAAGVAAAAGAAAVVGAKDPHQPVRLASCVHVFHRQCIAMTVKLQGKCPLCKQGV